MKNFFKFDTEGREFAESLNKLFKQRKAETIFEKQNTFLTCYWMFQSDLIIGTNNWDAQKPRGRS